MKTKDCRRRSMTSFHISRADSVAFLRDNKSWLICWQVSVVNGIGMFEGMYCR